MFDHVPGLWYNVLCNLSLRKKEKMTSQLPEIVQALLDPEVYPDPTPKIELIQTQMSFVFMAGDYVYKVKKPVDLGYLDYTTLEKRRFYCQREIELNRRLCPDIYLGVISLTRHNGDILIEGPGDVVEYAVKMRRLPEEAMLNVLLAKNQVSVSMITRLARKLAEFHKKAETNTIISTYGDPDAITEKTEENFSQTERYVGNTLSPDRYRHLKDYTNTFIKNNAHLFRKRIADGRIRDCHGDVYATHVCITDGIYIYDCIEFNEKFRYCDVASEVAFLAMDLDHYGHADLSQSFIDSYVNFSRDEELRHILTFYKCYFACVRGRVESLKLDDPHISHEEKASILAVAKRYFELAESYIS